jgi:hypothetical protein
MKIVHFRLDHHVLREALQRVPGMQVEWIRSDVVEPGHRIQVHLWAVGGDFEVFEAGLEDDPTVTPPTLTGNVGDRRLYQLDIVGVGAEKSIYPYLNEQGCVIQRLTAAHDGWDCRVGFLDQSSVSGFFTWCSTQGLDTDIYCMYDTNEYRGEPEFGLTTPQRETLTVAFETGYFDIPRSGTLQALGDQLGVSDTAASQRVRRGMKTLVRQTVYRGVEKGR